MVFRHLISDVRCACFEKKAQQNENLDSVLYKFELERSYFDKLLYSANFCHRLRHVSSVAFLVAQP